MSSPPPASVGDEINAPIVLFMLTISLVFIYVSFQCFYRRLNLNRYYYVDEYQTPDVELGVPDLPRPRPRRQQQSKVEVQVLSKEVTGKDKAMYYSSDECVICLEDFDDGDSCKVLIVCNHIYHKPCIDGWFARGKYQCPICGV